MTHHDRKFQVLPFINPSGETVFRVSGWKGNKRIRENHRTEEAAKARRNELENEWLGGSGAAPVVRAVGFPLEFQKAAESAFAINPDPGALLAAVRYWASDARQQVIAASKAPKLDEAARAFLDWCRTPAASLRPDTFRGYKGRLEHFVARTGNIPLPEITTDYVLLYLGKTTNVPGTERTIRQILARFFSWCIQRPRRWIAANPADRSCIPFKRSEPRTPEIFTWRQILKIIAVARRFDDGVFLPDITRQLFCGMRPTEARRMSLKGLSIPNMELRLEPSQTKTRRARIIHLDPVAIAWFQECAKLPAPKPGHANKTTTWNRFLAKLRFPWIPDGLRHTAITYKFRANGSYGLTAEWAGNSEGIIKRHYQGRGVTTSDATRYWALFPSRDERRRWKAAGHRRKTAKPSNVIQFPNAASPAR